MTTVRRLHEKAMDFSQRAMLAREKGEESNWRSLNGVALEYELRAASRIELAPGNEPTRSILYRSAASIAIDAGDFRQAEKCIAQAYLGEPPHEVRFELGELSETIRFRERLESRGLVLQPGELELHMEGASIGFGMISYREFVRRSNTIVDLLQRTSDRLEQQHYQADRRGRKARKYEPVLATPEAASFAVKFRMAEFEDTPKSLFSTPEAIIKEVVTGVKLVLEGASDKLETHIGEEKYFNNFISLALELAPDGRHITSVSLASQGITAEFHTTKKEIQEHLPRKEQIPTHDEPRFLEGTLVVADARSSGKVTVRTNEGDLDLWVKDGLDDVVRAHFNNLVTVGIENVGNRKILVTIEEAEEKRL